MDEILLKLFKLKQFPPILLPIVWILYIIVFPFYVSKPLFKWLIGKWTCYFCGREYSSKDKRLEVWSYETRYYKCEACDTMRRLEQAK